MSDERDKALAWLRERFPGRDVREFDAGDELDRRSEVVVYLSKFDVSLRAHGDTPQAAAEACWAAWEKALKAALDAARAEERERCAKVCDEGGAKLRAAALGIEHGEAAALLAGAANAHDVLAAAIRALGPAGKEAKG